MKLLESSSEELSASSLESFTSDGGIMTLSTTWIIPFEANTSVVVTSTSPIITLPSILVSVKLSPLAIASIMPSVTSAPHRDPG